LGSPSSSFAPSAVLCKTSGEIFSSAFVALNLKKIRILKRTEQGRDSGMRFGAEGTEDLNRVSKNIRIRIFKAPSNSIHKKVPRNALKRKERLPTYAVICIVQCLYQPRGCISCSVAEVSKSIQGQTHYRGIRILKRTNKRTHSYFRIKSTLVPSMIAGIYTKRAGDYNPQFGVRFFQRLGKARDDNLRLYAEPAKIICDVASDDVIFQMLRKNRNRPVNIGDRAPD